MKDLGAGLGVSASLLMGVSSDFLLSFFERFDEEDAGWGEMSKPWLVFLLRLDFRLEVSGTLEEAFSLFASSGDDGLGECQSWSTREMRV